MADLVRDGVLTEIEHRLGREGPVRQVGHADPDRARATRSRRSPQQALQAARRSRRRSAANASRSTASPARFRSSRLIRHCLDHQREVVSRRLKYELRNAALRACSRLPHRPRQHRRGDRDDPRVGLDRRRARGPIEKFSLSEIQAQAILDMRLRPSRGSSANGSGRVRRPPGTDRRALEILGDEHRIDGVIRESWPSSRSASGRTTTAAPRSPPARGARARGHDRRGGHGHRDHPLGYQAAPGHHLSRAASRRDRRGWGWR
jgi:hypothetical protein